MSTVKRRRLLAYLFLIAASIFMSGCAARPVPVEVSPKGMIHPPKVAKLPLSVGVYYSTALRDHQLVVTPGLIPFAVRSGRASVTLFDQVLPLAFEHVVAVSGRPPLAGEGANLVAVLEPSIE